MNLRRIALLAAALSCLSAVSVRAADNAIFPTGSVFRITGLTWGSSAAQGFNNNFFFTPLSLNENVCVYVKNNNTTNPHTFTTAIVTNSDPGNSTPSDGTWLTAASSTGMVAVTSPGIASGIGANVSGVAQVSINFSNSGVQAGSPETATVTIIQTSGQCFGGANFIQSQPAAVNTIPQIQALSDGLSQSYFATPLNSIVAFAAQSGIVENVANQASSSRSLYFDHAFISCSAACQIQLFYTTAPPTGCGGTGGVNKMNNPTTGSASVATQNTGVGCTAATGQSLASFFLSANSSIQVPLNGYIAPAGTTTGIASVVQVSYTGTVGYSIFWSEK